MDKNKKRNINKVLLITFLVVIILPLSAVVFFSISDSETKEKEQLIESSEGSIPVTPVEYTLNCEKIGFVVESSYDSETGHIWKCTRKNDGVEEIVQVYSLNMEETKSVRVTVQLDVDKTSTAALSIFKTMARIPYTGNTNENCIAMQKWIEENLNNDKASKVFDGGVKLEIFAPSDLCRMMDISKEN